MQIHNSALTSGGGAGEKAQAQGSNMEKHLERLQARKESLEEKTSDSNSSSLRHSFGPNTENTKIIMGSGGDHAVIGMGKTPAVTVSESAAPTATGQGAMGQKQKALIDSINQPYVSDEARAVIAELEAGAENLRQRDAALDAEFSLHVQDLVQALKPPSSSASADWDKTADDDSDDDSETLLERIAAGNEELMMFHQQSVGNATGATRAVATDPNGVVQAREPEHPAPTADDVGHVDEYL